MDGIEWRLIDPEPRPKQPGADGAQPERGSRLWLGAVVALVLLSAGLAIWATLPAGGVVVDARASNGLTAPLGAVGNVPDGGGYAASPGQGALAPASAGTLVVDVQGAVNEPGLHELPAGSRVGDAIAAAGGYSTAVDVAAAAAELNLAAKLADGEKVRVPRLGDTASAAEAPQSPGTAPGSGLVNLNTATPEQLDTLPGVGPVTAAKIIDAREQAPLASVDELLERGVVGPATLEKIRELVTV
jgi:competence protein ComEA